LLFIPQFDTIYIDFLYLVSFFMKIKVKNRSTQDMSHMGSYLNSFLPYAQKKMGFNRPPTIFFDSDPENAQNVLGKTGYYNPETDEIVVFVDKRHPKDILRSLSHELVHHAQNCRGDLKPEVAGETTPGYAQTNAHMRDMESEAYKFGSGLYFRDWEDSLKNPLKETNYKHTTGDIHKMSNYDQLKEEITKKVVTALTEKLKGNQHKIDADKDGKITGKDFAQLRKDKDVKKESAFAPNHYCLHHGGVQHEGKIHMAEAVGHNWNKEEHRVTHYDMKLENGTILENVPFEEIQVTNASLAQEHMHSVRDDDDDDDLEERKKRDTPRDSDRREDVKLKVNEREMPEKEPVDPEEVEHAPKAKDAKPDPRLQEEAVEEVNEEEEEETVEEATSNDEWYQNELFENLKKRWAK